MNIIHWPFGERHTPLNGIFLAIVVFTLSAFAGAGFHLGWQSIH